MPDAILTIFKLGLLALLYLFFLRVLRAVWVEVRSEGNDLDPRQRAAGPTRARPGSESKKPRPVGDTRRLEPTGQDRAPSRGQTRNSARMDQGGAVNRAGPPQTSSAPRDIIVTNERGQPSAPIAIGSLVTVGRAESCEIRINDSFSSQMHARVFDYEGVTYLEDLNSTNGTFLNDTKVSGTAPLHVGDLIQIGNTTLELQ